jgi:amidohydrolase
MDHRKERVAAAIDARRDDLIALTRQIGARPELGYFEFETARTVAHWFRDLGIPYRDGLALTGVKGELAGGAPGPTVCVIGELDALAVSDHPDADPETGAVHACGHHAQIGMLLGVAVGLLQSGVLPELAGRVVLFAVPAEEYVQIARRLELRRAGRIEFLVGKAELIRLGEFDDVDLALMCHTSSRPEDRKFRLGVESNGMVAKFVRFLGRPAHAGGAPWDGVNALNAANLALMAIHAQRETFRDEDHIRVHPIITKGGEVVSSVPADVRLETFVRGRTAAALQDAVRKVDRALRAGALAVGARVQITTVPGYLPLRQDPNLTALFQANAERLVGPEEVVVGGFLGGSTDMGDLGHLMPTVHPMVGGATGTGHGNDYRLADPDLALIGAAKALALTVVDLLADGAAAARRVLAAFRPALTKAEYLALLRSLASEREYAEA